MLSKNISFGTIHPEYKDFSILGEGEPKVLGALERNKILLANETRNHRVFIGVLDEKFINMYCVLKNMPFWANLKDSFLLIREQVCKNKPAPHVEVVHVPTLTDIELIAKINKIKIAANKLFLGKNAKGILK